MKSNFLRFSCTLLLLAGSVQISMVSANSTFDICNDKGLVVGWYEKTKVCTATESGLEYVKTDKFQDDVELRSRDDIYDGFGYQILNFGKSDKYIAQTSSGNISLSSSGYLRVVGNISVSGMIKVIHFQGDLHRETYMTWGGYVPRDLPHLEFGKNNFIRNTFQLQIENFIDGISWDVSSNKGSASISATGMISVAKLQNTQDLLLRITVRAEGYRSLITEYRPISGARIISPNPLNTEQPAPSSVTVVIRQINPNASSTPGAAQSQNRSDAGNPLEVGPQIGLISKKLGDSISFQITNFDSSAIWEVTTNSGGATISPTGQVNVLDLEANSKVVIKIKVSKVGFTPIERDFTTFVNVTFMKISPEKWNAILVSPEKYLGKSFRIYGIIRKFDFVTANRAFLAETSGVSNWKSNSNKNFWAYLLTQEDSAKRFKLGSKFSADVTIVGSKEAQLDATQSRKFPMLEVAKLY